MQEAGSREIGPEKQLDPLRFREGETEFQIPSTIKLEDLTEYVFELEKILLDLGWSEADASNTGFAFHEVIQNAIIHGNLEIERENSENNQEKFEREIKARQKSDLAKRVVQIKTLLTRDKIQIKIADEGGREIKINETTPDPTAPENLLKPGGRGRFLSESFVDEIKYRFTGRGMEVTLTKTKGSTTG